MDYLSVEGYGKVLDWGRLVVKPLKEMLIDLVGFIPELLAAVFILLAGWLIALLCRFLVSRFLKSVGFNSIAGKIGISEITGKDDKKIAPNQVVGLMSFWGIVFISYVIMLKRLHLREVSFYLDRLFSYLVAILVISIIAVGGIVLSMVVHRIIRSTAKSTESSRPELFANIARWTILVFTGIACLSQIGVSIEMLLLPASAILVTFCITFILAFGFGGRKWAEKTLDRIGRK